MDIGIKKKVLLIILIITTLSPLIFIQLEKNNALLNLYLILAKFGALCGTMLFFWQFIFGFRQISKFIMKDLLWSLNLHKFIGKYASAIIILHPIFISLYYLEKKKINPILLEGSWPFTGFVFLGILAFLIFSIIIVSSIFFRSKISTKIWYSIHMLSFVALSFALLHSFFTGMNLKQMPLKAVWLVLMAIMLGLIVLRVMAFFNLFSKKHIVKKVTRVSKDVTKITVSPLGKNVEPKLGQFIYFRRGFFGPERPFTVSHYTKKNGDLSITVKSLGKVTSELQNIKNDEIVYIEGPYGVFARIALNSNRPIVMIAGGIGITPFIRIFKELAYVPNKEVHLFYGNKFKNEIVYLEEIENVETMTTVHVLSHDKDFHGESGFITTHLLKKYLHSNLSQYEYLICGPPVMTINLEKSLLDENIPKKQIHHELFSY